MQIFKRIRPLFFPERETELPKLRHLSKKKCGQNLIEFCFVFPTLIFLTLGIFEVAMFWQDLNSIYALNTEINANAALTDTSKMRLGSSCAAATDAQTLFNKRTMVGGLANTEILYGNEPFALYKYSSSTKVDGKPQATLWVDCRNPFENGITTQIEFYHRNIIMKAAIPRMDGGEPIVLIPDNVFIASPKLNTIRHY